MEWKKLDIFALSFGGGLEGSPHLSLAQESKNKALK